MKNSITAILLVALALVLFPAHAYAVQQEVTFTINPDFSASGVWKIPVSSQNDNVYRFSNMRDFGSTGIMDYTLSKISNSEGELPMERDGAGFIVRNTYKSGSHSGINDLFVAYDVKTALTKPLAVYEVWVAGEGYFNAPVITISYPPDWKVVGVYPEGVQANGKITIEYPTNTPYIRSVLVAFVPPNPGVGNTVVTSGRFTLAGDKASVKKLQQAVAKMTYLDQVLKDSTGLSVPDSITVYAGDLRSVDVGYEAEALAARPNLILYNKDFILSETLAQTQTVLLHEITHLAEQDLNLFKGAPYVAPWFKEGLSVFVENQGRSYIYPNSADAAVADVFGDSRLFTPAGLKDRMDYQYDYLFNGDYTTTMGESYSMGGVALKRFFNLSGVAGIQKLFSKMKDASSNQVLPMADSERILSDMSTITGLATGDLIMPFKGSSTFVTDVATLTRPEYSDSDIDAIVIAFKSRVPNYLSGSSVADSPVKEEVSVEDVVPKDTAKAIISVVGNLFGLGKKEVEPEIETPAVVSDAPVGTTTATTTPTQTPPKETKSWFAFFVDFLSSLIGGKKDK